MQVLQEVSVVCMLLCLMVIYSQQTREVGDPIDALDTTTPSRRQRRTVDRGNNPLQALVNALQTDGMTNADLYMHYTPSTPSPQDINCYVEVPTTVRRGGKCIRLGDWGIRRGRRPRTMLWGCQAGLHLDFSADCQRRGRRSGRG